MTIARRFVYIALLLMTPTAVFANGIVPILNFFNRETWQPATMATLVIILVEAALLRWRIKTLPFLGTLWRTAVINLASSAAGSLVLADGESPSLAIAAGTILVSDETGFRLLDSEGKTLRRIRDARNRMMQATCGRCTSGALQKTQDLSMGL